MLDRNDSNQAQEAALDIVSLVEQLESLLRDLNGFTEHLPREYRQEAQLYCSRVQAIFEAINTESLSPEAMKTMTKSLSETYPSKIQRMGIASQLIAARKEAKYTLQEISERFGISPGSLKTFYKAYDAARPSEKAKMQKSSVYDIQDNMENLHAMMLRTIARFELDGEINAKNLSEYRQLLALAQKQLKEFTQAQKFEKLATVIEEVLLRHCLPEARKEIMAEFQRIGLTGFLEPMSTTTRLRG